MLKLYLFIAPDSVLTLNEVSEFVVYSSTMWKKKQASRANINKTNQKKRVRKAY